MKTLTTTDGTEIFYKDWVGRLKDGTTPSHCSAAAIIVKQKRKSYGNSGGVEEIPKTT
jgi:hypothetical protein